MSLWLAVLLGLVQGLTEFLPVSSSGHLVLFQTIFGQNIEENYVFFDLLLHLGTLIAVFAAFWKDIKELIVEFFKMAADRFRIRNKPARRFIVLLLVSIVPLILAAPFKDNIEKLFESPVIVGFALLATAVLLFLSDHILNGKKDASNAKISDAIVVGVMQCLALIPGLSRSGSTISAGVFRGFSREFAVKFAFIMSIPAILGANILSIPEALYEMTDYSVLPVYLAGVAVAAVSGYFAIHLVRLLAKKKGFSAFAVYCAVLGIVTIIINMI